MSVVTTEFDASDCDCCGPWCEHCVSKGKTWLLTIAGSPCTAINRAIVMANQFGEDDNDCMGLIAVCTDGEVADIPPPCVSPATAQYSITYSLETGTILGDTKCWIEVHVFVTDPLPANLAASFRSSYEDCPMDCVDEWTLTDVSVAPFNTCVDGDTTCTMQSI